MGRDEAGQLGYFDVVHPTYTIIHADHQISSCWSAYTANFAAFYARVEADEAQAAQATGPVGKPDQPANRFEAGMLPWLHFDSYTPMPAAGLSTFQPVLQAGKYLDGQMPLSITVNHAVADGYHVSELFRRLQAAFETPDWL
jgi:chloramphenicol O-acetyltransferase type A